MFRYDVQNDMHRTTDHDAKFVIDAHERTIFRRRWTEKRLTESRDGVEVFARLKDPRQFFRGSVRFTTGPIGQKNKLRVELKGTVCLREAPHTELDICDVPNFASAMEQGVILTWCGRDKQWVLMMKQNPFLAREFDTGNVVLEFKDRRRDTLLWAQRMAFADHGLDIDQNPKSTKEQLCDRLPPHAEYLENHVLTKFSVDDGAAMQLGFELMMLPHFQLETQLKLSLPFLPSPLLSCIQLFCFWPVDGCL